jgi:hypothetical protein
MTQSFLTDSLALRIMPPVINLLYQISKTIWHLGWLQRRLSIAALKAGQRAQRIGLPGLSPLGLASTFIFTLAAPEGLGVR